MRKRCQTAGQEISAHSIRIVALNEDRRLRVKAKQRASWERVKAYLNGVHSYQMSIGAARLGPVVEMTGKEARDRNRALERKFIDKLKSSKQPGQMSRWVLAREGNNGRTQSDL